MCRSSPSIGTSSHCSIAFGLDGHPHGAPQHTARPSARARPRFRVGAQQVVPQGVGSRLGRQPPIPDALRPLLAEAAREIRRARSAHPQDRAFARVDGAKERRRSEAAHDPFNGSTASPTVASPWWTSLSRSALLIAVLSRLPIGTRRQTSRKWPSASCWKRRRHHPQPDGSSDAPTARAEWWPCTWALARIASDAATAMGCGTTPCSTMMPGWTVSVAETSPPSPPASRDCQSRQGCTSAALNTTRREPKA